jgi:signal transduction histidine kinase
MKLRHQLKALDRWQFIWGVFFYVLLAYGTWSALSEGIDSRVRVALTLTMAITLGAWYAFWVVIRAGSSGDLAYLVGAAGLWAALTAIQPEFLTLGVGIFAPLCLHDPRWAAMGAAVVGGGWIWILWSEEGSIPWAAVAVVVLLMAGWWVSAAYVSTIIRQSRERQRLLEELRAAQAELAEVERQTGVLEERQRLARDIHDTLTQGFASIVMLLEATEASLEPGHSAGRNVARALRSARDNLAESRRLVWALRPQPLQEAPLPVALDALAHRLSEETGIHAATVITGAPRSLDGRQETTLLRAAQESLANVRRHARATAVTLTLSYMDDVIVLDVHDDGVGFADEGAARDMAGRGLGLRAMRERAEELGGSVSLESVPGEGTTIVVSVPAAPSSAHAEARSRATS